MHVIKSDAGETSEATGAQMFEGPGQVWRRPLVGRDTGLGKDFNVGVVQFGAGARTRLHTHSSDQVLYVVSGIGKVGTREDEWVVSVGDCIVIPAGEPHWHGAHDTGSPMSHITITAHDAESSVLE